MQIREQDPERDAAAIVAVIRESSPLALVNVDSWRHFAAATPERAQFRGLVAELDGRVVAQAYATLSFFGGDDASANVLVMVAQEARRRGIGSALYDAALEHAVALGAPQVLSTFEENDDGVAFARARGWRGIRVELWSVVDPRTVTVEPDPAIDVRPARDLDPRELHHVDEEATRDMPQAESFEGLPYDEWLEFVWRHPFFTPDGSFGAVVDGRVAAVSLLIADRDTGRGLNMFTGTLREFRGRGLARAAKVASTRWAAANGVTQVATRNDETNASMLAINRRLGYRAAGCRVEYELERDRRER